MNTSNNDVMPTIRQASGDFIQGASHAADMTPREHAHEALDKAQSRLRQLRGNVDPVVDMLAAKAQKMAQHSLDLASEARERAEQSLKRAAGVTTRYVAEQPVRSILIAAGVGAGVALLVAAARQRSLNRPKTRY
jgi:ElaB/YqjD/DUF883 family membrane-anchored ribosome-binding protein